MRFEDLMLRFHLTVAEQEAQRDFIARRNDWVDETFPKLLREHGFGTTLPTDPAFTGMVLVIATYHNLELVLLDDLAWYLDATRRADVRILDSGEFPSQERFDEVFPGIGKVYQTPVVGIWSEGSLNHVATGKPARDLVRTHFGLRLKRDL